MKTTARTIVVALLIGAPAYGQVLVPMDPAAGKAIGINNHGDVLFARHVFIQSNQQLVSLGSGNVTTDSGPVPVPFTGAAINDNGDVAGTLQFHAGLRDSAGNITDLGVMPGMPLTSSSGALGLNNLGFVVGVGQLVGLTRAWYAAPGGALNPLVPPGTSASPVESTGNAINDAGFITGSFYRFNPDPSGLTRVAYRFDTNTSQWTEIGMGSGNAINAAGAVAGVLHISQYGCTRAFLFDDSGLKNLGTLSDSGCSVALAISDSGIVGGWSHAIVGQADEHPFIYHGALQDVNDLVALNDPSKSTAQLHDVAGITADGLLVLNGQDKTNPNTPVVRAWLLQIPPVVFTDGTQDFGEVVAGSTSAPKTVVMTNRGSSAVTINSTLARGSFAQTNDCPGTLAAGASCSFNVTFSPPAAGSYGGGLTVTVNGAGLKTRATGQTPMPVTLTTPSTNVTAQVPFTLSWNSPTGSDCYLSTPTGILADGDWSTLRPASGSVNVTSLVAKDFAMSVQCTLNGAVGTATIPHILASWPTTTATLTPSATTVYAGTTFTMNWSSTFANECYPTSIDDPAWAVSWRPASGSIVLTAPNSLSAPLEYTYRIRCENFGSHLSATAQVVVTMNPGPAPGSSSSSSSSSSGGGSGSGSSSGGASAGSSGGGGGGSMDVMLLCGLGGMLTLALSRRRRASARPSLTTAR